MKKRTKCLLVLLIITFNALVANAQQTFTDYYRQHFTLLRQPNPPHGQQVAQNNEIVVNTNIKNANFYDNPLQLNGKTLDYDNFTMNSKGTLKVILGNPDSKDAEPVPFYITIRSNGKFVQDKKMPFLNKALYQVNLSDIMPYCQIDDVLIISPAREEDGKAKRILKLLLGGGC
jgi:hypothetical protein